LWAYKRNGITSNITDLLDNWNVQKAKMKKRELQRIYEVMEGISRNRIEMTEC
jgi:hypothetical protein